MIVVKRTNSKHPDFVAMVALLDEDLAKRDGDEHAFYAQFNNIDHIEHALVAYMDKTPLGCGAVKEFSKDSVEVKRMYVSPQSRGQGIGAKILSELERWAAELSYKKCVLETGKKQPEAIALYKKAGYKVISNYGQYKGVENSVCFQKLLAP